MIRHLDADVAHSVDAAQIIPSLAAAVKELVENALDSSAKAIHIAFDESGCESVSISDDGCGIPEDDFELVATPHSTSKLTDLDGVSSGKSYGFRGQALSALAAVSENLMITTKTANSKCAYQLKFNWKGELFSKTICHRNNGTTVTVEKLFSRLPVRQKALRSQISREFAKAVHIIQSYSLLFPGINISAEQVKRKENILHASAVNSMKARIVQLFGAKMVDGIVDVKPVLPNTAILEEFDLPSECFNSVEDGISVSGLIGLAEIGRCSSDRQFLFINGRIADSMKISRLINQVFKEKTQTEKYPIYALNVKLPSNVLDVNLAADKKLMMISDEKILLALMKSSLLVALNVPNRKMEAPLSQSFITDHVVVKNGSENSEKNHSDDVSKSNSASRPIFSNDFDKEPDQTGRNVAVPIFSNGSDKEPDQSVRNFSIGKVEKVKEPEKDFSTIERPASALKTRESGSKCARLVVEPRDSDSLTKRRKFTTVGFSMEQLKTSIAANAGDPFAINCNHSNKAQETSLDRTIFQKFRENVIGQFNLGFIACKDGCSLWLLDQHACDERLNFELLLNTAEMQTQQLLQPMSLPFSPAEIDIICDHMRIFERNGYKFRRGPSNELQLTAIPELLGSTMSKQDDLEELLQIVGDCPTFNARPSRVKSLLATRACKRAIKIGEALNRAQMVKLVDNMVTENIANPFQCAHGRPSIKLIARMCNLPV